MVVPPRVSNAPKLSACREELEPRDLSQMPLLGEGVDKHEVSAYIIKNIDQVAQNLRPNQHRML